MIEGSNIPGAPPHDDDAAGITRRRLLERGTVLGGALLLPSWLAACGGGGSSTSTSGSPAQGGQPKRGGRLRTGHSGGGSSETLDPATSLNLIDEARDRQLYDTLTFFDRKYAVQPHLAESLEPNAKADVWQLKLRSGVTFHDGKALTVDDVLYTWQRVLDPKTASGGAAAISNIDLKRTKKVSDTELRVVLKVPQVDLPYLLSGREISIVPAGTKSFKQPIGTGPFSFVSWTPGQRSLFKRNPNYWGDGPYVDELEMISIADATARVNALIGGQVDAIENLPFTDTKAHKNDPQMKVLVTKTPTCIPFVMQTDAKPFDNPDVREAFKLAIDRPKVVESAFLGYGQVGNDVFGLGTPSYDSSIPQREYDPEKAKALLKGAGAEGISIVLNTNPGTVGNVESAQAFAEQAKAAGIDIKVKSWDSGKFGSDIYNQVPFFHTYWNFPNEIMFPYAFTKGAPYNETHFTSDRFAKLYREAEATVDTAKRKEIYGELERETADGGYLIWGYLDFTDAVSPKVQGVETHPYFNLGAFQFKDWWLS